MKWSKRKDIGHKNSMIEGPGFQGYKQFRWYRTLLCYLGIHCGNWTYTSMSQCEQTRICASCARRQTRIRHTWGILFSSPDRRKCHRCGKVEILDATRENLIIGLHRLGVSAKIADWGRPEQNTGESSIGLIDIENSPISWINVRCWDNEGPVYATDYGIPDSRPLPNIKIKSVRVRNFPLLGKVIDVRWQGNNMALNVAYHLTTDQTIREAIIANHSEITVLTCPKQGCWLIPCSGREVPKPSQWDFYQKIAAKLLVVPLTRGEK